MSSREDVLVNGERRLFYLSSEVGNNTIGKLNFWLLSLIQEDDERETKEKDFIRKPIKIYVNSFGGSIYDMWSLIDIITNSKTPIHTYCTGYAMSAACKIFLAGHKRFISKHATLLYHQMGCMSNGTYQDVVENMEQMTYLQNMIEEFVSSKTKMTKDELKRIRENKIDYYIHPEDAVKLGFADEII